MKNVLKDLFLVLIWVLSLCTAGSDGPYMPWANLVALLVFLITSIMLGVKYHKQRRGIP